MGQGVQRQPRLLRAVRPRPGLPDDAATPPTSACGRPPGAATSTRRCSSHEQEGELLRALAEFPRVVASAAELREPHRVARYLEDTAAVFHRFYDTVPGAAAWATSRPTTCQRARLVLVAATRTVHRQRPRPARRLRPGADVTRARPRGRLPCTPTSTAAGPPGCGSPSTPTRSSTTSGRATAEKTDGVLSVGGVALTDLAAEHGTPAYVLDEADFRARARGVPRRVRRLRRLLRRQGVPLLDGGPLGRRGGALPRRLLRAASSPSRCGPASTRRGSATTATTRRTTSCGARSKAGVGRIIVDSFDEIDRLEPTSPASGLTARVMVRVTAGVEAHTHEYIATAHEDQKFGFSITGGDAFEAVRRVRGRPGPRAARPALPHRQPDLRHLRLRGRGPPGAGAARPDLRRARRRAARDGPRRRLRHRLHHPGRPVRPRRSWPPR